VKEDNDRLESSVVDSPSATLEPQGVATGMLVGFAPRGKPLVEVSAMRFHARSCCPLHLSDVGREVVVAFEPARPDNPIVLGVVRPAEPVEVVVDGENLTLSAHQSITLKCGKASITLNRDGKVIIRGAHVVSHASGVNRIRGGSIDLN
jgi:hypothetical protein